MVKLLATLGIMVLCANASEFTPNPSCSQLQTIADIYADASFPEGRDIAPYWAAQYIGTVDIMDNYGCQVDDEDYALRDKLEQVLVKLNKTKKGIK